MKALVVQYLLRGEASNTKKLLDAALDVLKAGKVSVQTLDLAKDVPDLFSADSLSVYYERNYGGQKVSAERAGFMAKMDRMTEQLKSADILIVAFPMYNFSQPAAVKAWFDSVMQKGETWTFGDGGAYVGLMKGKKALVLSSSGGAYEGPYASMDHATTLTKVHLGFMGFEAESVTAAGINMFPGKAAEIVSAAQEKTRAVLKAWI